MTSARICLITPGHLASTPRLVKEADALHAAGFDVRVVAADHFAAVRPLDESVLSRVPWRCDRVTPGGQPARIVRRIGQALAQRRFSRGSHSAPRLAVWAHHPNTFRLAAAARREPADLYLGHCVAGLAAAGLAASHHRVPLGFDAEDFHRCELSDTPSPAVVALENHWLPRCQHFTAASPLIAQAYAEACRVPAPVVVLNVFPLAEKPTTAAAPASGPPTLYWFSQTIGPERGLEPLMQFLACVPTTCDVHLRGLPAAGYPDALTRRARSAGFHGQLHFHGLAPPDSMVQLAAGHAVGLALEQSVPRNRDLCLTNKIFTYLLAGTPVLLTPTSAHRRLAPDLSEAALCLDLALDSSISHFDAFLRSPGRRAAASAYAGTLARTRYNWEVEQQIFLQAIRTSLSRTTDR